MTLYGLQKGKYDQWTHVDALPTYYYNQQSHLYVLSTYYYDTQTWSYMVCSSLSATYR